MEPESVRVWIRVFGIRSEVMEIVREFGLYRADALSHGSIGALVSLMQSSVSAELRGLLMDFLTPSQTWLWRSYL